MITVSNGEYNGNGIAREYKGQLWHAYFLLTTKGFAEMAAHLRRNGNRLKSYKSFAREGEHEMTKINDPAMLSTLEDDIRKINASARGKYDSVQGVEETFKALMKLVE